MGRMDLSGRLRIQMGGPVAKSAMPGNHLLGLSLARVEVDTGVFRSTDLLTRRREGLFKLTLAGQETVLPFNGKGRIELDASRQIAFFGRRPASLAVGLELVETDARTRAGLARGMEVAKIAGAATGAFGVPYGVAGFGLAGALFDYLRLQARDDQEVLAFAVVDPSLGDGSRLHIEVGDPARPVLRLELVVEDLGPEEGPKALQVRLARPWFEFGEQRLVKLSRAANGKGRRRTTMGVRQWLVEDKRLSHFSFTAASGRNKAAVSTRFDGLEQVLSWECWELFAATGVSGASRHLLPLSLSFALNRLDGAARAAVNLLKSGMEVVAELAPEAKPAATLLRKAGRDLADLLSELEGTELPLFQFDGVVVLLPSGSGREVGKMGGGRLLMAAEPRQANVWRREIVGEFSRWRKAPLGRFGFTLEVHGG